MLRYLIIMLITITLTVGILLGPHVMESVVERTAPDILVSDLPRGIGIAPSSITFKISDFGAGLDALVVRLYQRGTKHILLKKSFTETYESTHSIELPGKEAGVEEGEATLEIRVFDKSYWNNATEKQFVLPVDYRTPELELLSTQHNIRKGGSQLIFYKAKDSNLVAHGVRYKNKTLFGFKTGMLSEELDVAHIYGSIFTLPENVRRSDDVRLFAEDSVGNVKTTPFPYRLLRPYKRSLTHYVTKREENVSAEDYKNFLEEKVPAALREIMSSHPATITPKAWSTPFMRFPGAIHVGLGDEVEFFFNRNLLCKTTSSYYSINLVNFNYQAPALQDGRIAYVGTDEILGTVVIIDHGLGLRSLYANLKKVFVKTGSKVVKGDIVGTPGKSAPLNGILIKPQNVLYQLYVQNTPVNPQEWWDTTWYGEHIENKIKQLKAELGLEILNRGL